MSQPLPRPASYACAVGLLRRALQLEPLSSTEQTVFSVTLHSCRRLLPTLGGQLLMTIEARRTLGHWGPNSPEPLRYDTSQCVSELAYKSQIAEKVGQGWRPGPDFEPPHSHSASAALTSPPPSAAQPQTAHVPSDAQSKGWIVNAAPPRGSKPKCVHMSPS